jgi:hypothetical protein
VVCGFTTNHNAKQTSTINSCHSERSDETNYF